MYLWYYHGNMHCTIQYGYFAVMWIVIGYVYLVNKKVLATAQIITASAVVTAGVTAIYMNYSYMGIVVQWIKNSPVMSSAAHCKPKM